MRTIDPVPYTDDMMRGNSEPTTVHMIPDCAETVLWLDGPVDYEHSGLSPELIRGLQEWEQSYCESLDSDLEWRSPKAARAFTAVGIDMAGQVADELGDEFVVEFASYDNDAPTHTVRSLGPGSNNAASAAFAEIVARMEAMDECAARIVADRGLGAEWAAVAPLSGDVFNLGDQGGRAEGGD